MGWVFLVFRLGATRGEEVWVRSRKTCRGHTKRIGRFGSR